MCSDSDEFATFADVTADFVYARLMRAEPDTPTGYSEGALKAWAARAQRWALGEEPEDLPRIEQTQAPCLPRDVFLYFISGAKERNPAAAAALLAHFE
jgi:uncharacterized protein YecE (DUF72 family)